MESRQKALELGDGFETDLRFSKDGVIVLIHDEVSIHRRFYNPHYLSATLFNLSTCNNQLIVHQWVNRTTNGTGRVADMTLAELEALDAGTLFIHFIRFI